MAGKEIKEVTAYVFAGRLYKEKADAEYALAHSNLTEFCRKNFSDFSEDVVDALIRNRNQFILLLQELK